MTVQDTYDFYAAWAMQAILVRGPARDPADVAKEAAAQADAMMVERALYIAKGKTK